MAPKDGRYTAEIGVSVAVEHLLRAGYQVAIPIIDDGYDLLAFDGRKYWRIQVKATARSGKNQSRIRTSRGRGKRGRYTADEVDAFVVVHVVTGVVMCVPFRDAKGRAWINFSQHKRYSNFGVLREMAAARN